MLDAIRKAAAAAVRELHDAWVYRGVPDDTPFTHVIPTGLDYRGVPTAECMCGSRTFYAVVWFADDYEVRGYDTCGLCCDCHALVTMCTEIDHPEYEGSV